jgi:hypothetical protein
VSRSRAAAGALVAAAVMLALGAGSRAPWRVEDDRAAIRLAWQARSERSEECRPLTEEERARRPVHMRRSEVCETRAVAYLLRVAVDDRVVVADTVRGAGARADRPVHVSRELRVPPGEHALEVSFRPLAEGPDTAGLSLFARVRLAPRDVALVTHDAGGDELVLREP